MSEVIKNNSSLGQKRIPKFSFNNVSNLSRPLRLFVLLVILALVFIPFLLSYYRGSNFFRNQLVPSSRSSIIVITPTPIPSSLTPVPTSPVISGDNVSPKISFFSPPSGTKIANNSVLSAYVKASDNVGIKDVQFKLGETQVCDIGRQASGIYYCDLKIAGYSGESLKITVTAYDGSGNSAVVSSDIFVK